MQLQRRQNKIKENRREDYNVQTNVENMDDETIDVKTTGSEIKDSEDLDNDKDDSTDSKGRKSDKKVKTKKGKTGEDEELDPEPSTAAPDEEKPPAPPAPGFVEAEVSEEHEESQSGSDEITTSPKPSPRKTRMITLTRAPRLTNIDPVKEIAEVEATKDETAGQELSPKKQKVAKNDQKDQGATKVEIKVETPAPVQVPSQQKDQSKAPKKNLPTKTTTTPPKVSQDAIAPLSTVEKGDGEPVIPVDVSSGSKGTDTMPDLIFSEEADSFDEPEADQEPVPELFMDQAEPVPNATEETQVPVVEIDQAILKQLDQPDPDVPNTQQIQEPVTVPAQAKAPTLPDSIVEPKANEALTAGQTGSTKTESPVMMIGLISGVIVLLVIFIIVFWAIRRGRKRKTDKESMWKESSIPMFDDPSVPRHAAPVVVADSWIEDAENLSRQVKFAGGSTPTPLQGSSFQYQPSSYSSF
jgi:hypothetical protein